MSTDINVDVSGCLDFYFRTIDGLLDPSDEQTSNV
jgi:hypothetical protein